MVELSVATTINPRFDHVTSIEATQSSVTVTHRCQVFAELLAVARSGLVDIVLIADDFELVRLEALQQMLDAQDDGPTVAAISDVADDRKRMAALGVPVVAPSLTGPELVEWLSQTQEHFPNVPEQADELTSRELRILDELDPDTSTERRRGRRAAPYDPATDLPATATMSDTNTQPLSGSSSTFLTPPLDEVVAELSPVTDQSTESVDNTNIEAATQEEDTPGGHLTAVWGPIGSPGVTTVAVNLAVESTLEGHRTLLIDADTYGAAVAVHLGLLDDTAAVAQACRAIEYRGIEAVEIADYVQHVNVVGGHLDVMTGLTRPERWPQLRTKAWEQLLDITRNRWDHIVVDCGFALEEDEELSFDIPAPQRNATTVTTVSAADTVLAVGTGDPVGLVRFMKGLEQLTAITSCQVVPVINKVTSMTSGMVPKRQLATAWERFGPSIALEHFIPWAPEPVAAALMEGKALAERAPKADIRQAVRQLLAVIAVTRLAQPHSDHSLPSGARWSFRQVVRQLRHKVIRGS